MCVCVDVYVCSVCVCMWGVYIGVCVGVCVYVVCVYVRVNVGVCL